MKKNKDKDFQKYWWVFPGTVFIMLILLASVYTYHEVNIGKYDYVCVNYWNTSYIEVNPPHATTVIGDTIYCEAGRYEYEYRVKI